MRRLNKAGIPILDDPKKANRLPPTTFCLPGEHRWVPQETATEYYDANHVVERTSFKCSRCPEKDVREQIVRAA